MDNPNIAIPDQIPVLVVDDEAPITQMIHQALSKAGYICHTAQSGEQALGILRENRVEVLITDIRMPGMSGVDLLKKAKAEYSVDVMVMTGFTEDYNYESVVAAGASDFIHKPISFRELMIRLQRVLRMRYLVIERQGALEEIEKSHQELEYAYLDTINRLVTAAEYKDEDTGDHIVRMSRYSALLAGKMGLPPDMVKLIRYASPMHDIGKIGIPDKILLKPGRLTTEEFDIIKTHTTIGADILADSKAEVLKIAHEIALNHHEKWNGKGYPNGLAGNDIPISGHIVAIVDTFDALTSKRPYKDPYPLEVALEIIQSESGRHFSPDLVDVFISNIDELEAIKHDVGAADNVSLVDFIWSERDREAQLDQRINVKKQ